MGRPFGAGLAKCVCLGWFVLYFLSLMCYFYVDVYNRLGVFVGFVLIVSVIASISGFVDAPSWELLDKSTKEQLLKTLQYSAHGCWLLLSES